MRNVSFSLIFAVASFSPARAVAEESGPGIASQEGREEAVLPPPSASFLVPGRIADLGYVGIEGGWDGARRGAVFESNVEAGVLGPLSVRAGVASSTAGAPASPSFLLKLDLLRQGRHGVDGAVFGGYRGQGVNLVPAIEIGIALGRRSGDLWLASSLAYGQGLEQGERYGDVRAAGLLHVRRSLQVGLDVRARFDLEIDDDEPPGETTVDGVAGPIVVLGVGRFALSGQTGVGIAAPRTGGATQVGATTRLGVAATF